MKKYNSILNENFLRPKKYEFRGKVMIADNKYVIKKRNLNDDNKDIFAYLESRNFNYYPNIYIKNNEYEIVDYIEEIEEPKEQKMQDLIDIVSLLHNKTTFYQDINEDDYKKIYEDITNNIEYLKSYYNDIYLFKNQHFYWSYCFIIRVFVFKIF